MSERTVEVFCSDPQKGRIKAGELVGTTFVKECSPRHIMRINDSLAIQEKVFQGILKMGCQSIRIKLSNEWYENPIEDWLEPRIKVLEFGRGAQRFFPRTKLKQLVT